MTRADRLSIIKELEKERENSQLITYITSTRRHAEVQMAPDAIRFFHDHLSKISDPKNATIDLFIHSNGGDGTVPWRLVNLIREYCKTSLCLKTHFLQLL